MERSFAKYRRRFAGGKPVTSCLCFRRWSREESSELTNVGTLQVAETLQQRDAATKQPVITFSCSHFFSAVARLLDQHLNFVPQFVGNLQSRANFIGLRPKYLHRSS